MRHSQLKAIFDSFELKLRGALFNQEKLVNEVQTIFLQTDMCYTTADDM